MTVSDIRGTGELLDGFGDLLVDFRGRVLSILATPEERSFRPYFSKLTTAGELKFETNLREPLGE